MDKFFPAEWLSTVLMSRLAVDEGSAWLQLAGAVEGSEGAVARAAADAVNVDPAIRTPDLPGLTVHVPPQPGHTYVIGADPAEGNPQSDESAAVVLDYANGEQVATLGLRCDPEMFAVHLDRLARLYDGVRPYGADGSWSSATTTAMP